MSKENLKVGDIVLNIHHTRSLLRLVINKEYTINEYFELDGTRSLQANIIRRPKNYAYLGNIKSDWEKFGYLLIDGYKSGKIKEVPQ